MRNLSGYARYSMLKMAERQFGWYRGCSRPLEDGERFFISCIFYHKDLSAKLGGTARKREARPMGRLLFLCF